MQQLLGAEVRAGLTVTDLSIVKQPARDGSNVVQCGVGAAKVQRIHQNPGVGRAAGGFDQRQSTAGVGHRRPGHELQVGRQAKGRHLLAQPGIAGSQARWFGVVTNHQHGAGAQCSAGLEQGQVQAGVKAFADAHDLQIKHAHASVAAGGQGLAHQRCVTQQVLIWRARDVGPQAQANKAVTGGSRQAHRLGCPATVGRQVGHGVVAHAHFSGDTAVGSAMVDTMSVLRCAGPPLGGQMPWATAWLRAWLRASREA